MKSFFLYLMRFFSGGLSSYRLVMVVWMFGVLLPWIVICLLNKKIEDIPSSVVTIIGLVLAGKVGQTATDKLNGKPTSPATPPASSDTLSK